VFGFVRKKIFFIDHVMPALLAIAKTTSAEMSERVTKDAERKGSF
jgi:hypothetical protein